MNPMHLNKIMFHFKISLLPKISLPVSQPQNTVSYCDLDAEILLVSLDRQNLLKLF